jgi:hypothetical protein
MSLPTLKGMLLTPVRPSATAAPFDYPFRYSTMMRYNHNLASLIIYNPSQSTYLHQSHLPSTLAFTNHPKYETHDSNTNRCG